MPVDIALRPVTEADEDALFEQSRDPESVRMAAFTRPDPDDRAAFDNTASLRVLNRANFKIINTGRGYAEARAADIEESILRLDG